MGNKEYEDRQIGKVCNTSRWKEGEKRRFVILLDGKRRKSKFVIQGGLDELSSGKRAKMKVHAKVVRYFILRPQLHDNMHMKNRPQFHYKSGFDL